MSESFNTNVANYKSRARSKKRICAVCSAPALGMNFNAMACPCCKAFFRRNALKQSVWINAMFKNQSCIIDESSRKSCAACRLEKCFAVGMNSKLIQTDEEKLQKKQVYFKQQQHQAEQSKEFFLPKENSFLSSLITDDDRFLINKIRHAYKIRIEYFYPSDIVPELLRKNNLPLNFSSLTELINARSIPIHRLILFFKSASLQFQRLNNDDKVTLIKYNISALFWLSTALFYDPITNTFCEDKQYDSIFDVKNLINFYGLDIYNKIIKYLCLLHEVIQSDPIIIYLLILILLFSHFSSCTSLSEPILNDYHHIRQAQNSYTTLLVRILIEKFGEQKSNLLVSKLILICLNIQNISRDIYNIELTQILDDNLSNFMEVFMKR